MVKMSRDWKLKRRTIHDPQWDDDEVVVIKDYYSDFDRQRVISASTEYIRDETTQEMRIIATLDKLHATKRKLAVVSWTLKSDDGQQLPFTEDNLLNLPAYVANFIDAEINKSWDDLGEPATSKEDAEKQDQQAKEDKATFLGSSVPSVERAEANSRTNDGSREGDSRRRGVEATGT